MQGIKDLVSLGFKTGSAWISKYLLWIKAGMVIMILAATFYAGYELKALRVEAGEASEYKAALEAKNKQITDYAASTKAANDRAAKAELIAQGLQTDLNEALESFKDERAKNPNYSCSIPPSGVQRIRKAFTRLPTEN